MLPSDLDPLRPDYSPEAQDQEGRFAERLGLALPDVLALREDIIHDLSPAALGVGCWAPHPDEARRILISDHLLQCVASIPINIVEAKLHYLELTDAWQQRSKVFVDALAIAGSDIFFHRPPVLSPVDDLPLRLSGLHIGGFFRGLVGTLDCLGAAIIGVAALPSTLLKADFTRARQRLSQVTPTSPGSERQVTLRTEIDNAIVQSGPKGWLEWATDYRNMYVHRGRRSEFFDLSHRVSPIVDHHGRDIVQVETPARLVKDPGRSDIEVLLQGKGALVLTEEARVTLDGLLTSTYHLVQRTSAGLLDLWRTRRDTPDLIHQPRQQWPDAASTDTTHFEGYKPGSSPYAPKAIMGNPLLVTRLRGAALADQDRHRWATFKH